MWIYLFFAVLAGCWIFSFAVPLLAIRWKPSSSRRFKPVLIYLLSAMVIAGLGSTKFYITSTAASGYVRHFDSRWLFIASFILGTFSLIHLVWKKKKSARGN